MSRLWASLAFLVLAVSPASQLCASEMDDFVNTKIKEEFIRTEGQQIQADYEYTAPPQQGLKPSDETFNLPLDSKAPQLHDGDPLGLGEQDGAMDMPRPGISKKIDPADPIERQIADKQAHDLYREHYRKAVQDAFIRNLNSAGYNSDRNLAEEIKAAEQGRPNTAGGGNP